MEKLIENEDSFMIPLCMMPYNFDKLIGIMMAVKVLVDSWN